MIVEPADAKEYLGFSKLVLASSLHMLSIVCQVFSQCL